MSESIRKAYIAGDYEKIRALTPDLNSAQNSTPEDYWYTGLACYSLGETAEAIKYLQAVVKLPGSGTLSVDAALLVAEILEDEGRYREAADWVVESLSQRSLNVDLQRSAASLLDLLGERYEANKYHLALVRSGNYSVDDLILLANRYESIVGARVEKAMRDSESTAFRVTRGLIAWQSGKLADAARLLRAEITDFPEMVAAHALLGRVILDQGKMDSLAEWHAKLPALSDQNPDIWYVRGIWAEHLNRPESALQCYYRAVELAPDFHEAVYRLSVVYSNNRDAGDVSEKLQERVGQLKRYKGICKSIFFSGPESQLVADAIDLTEKLERFHEAIAWCELASKGGNATASFQQRLEGLRSSIATEKTNSAGRWKLLDELQIPESDIPAWPDYRSFSTEVTNIDAAHFSAEDANLGLNFKYENGADLEGGLMIRQSMGGGVAVIDYDGDSWPDVFIPQAENTDNNGSMLSDGLFRNLKGESFSRVDALAGCGDVDYSHGASVGDVNDDGFSDLYVANSGKNRLYLNNGDGTFIRESDQFKTERWTISCVVADLDGDTFPDLFDVNYLEGRRPLTEVCEDSELGSPRTCPPDRFNGERDELHLNSRAGSFSNVTQEAGLSDLHGKGLGVVAADFTASGNVGLFVANDEVPNSFLNNDSQSPEVLPHFVNLANAAGLAFDGTGAALACMGIAASDINHDGYLDLFVTNFYRQPNTLYLSVGSGAYQDWTRPSGLAEPGLLKLGFGTQFLDANLDGEPDLVVGNGHLDDFSHKGIPFSMQPQLFLNQGKALFVESPAREAGPYFEEKHIARGLATLDWNRDGLTDFAVSHLGEPVELLTNDTRRHGHFLAIHLVGVASGRDAIGARVALTTDEQTRWQQTTAGDGYASSNEKLLTFGLADETNVSSVTITWPSGETQEFRNVEVDRHYIALESSRRLFTIAP